MKFISILTILLFVFSYQADAQSYKISVEVENLKDTTIYLGHHLGNGFFVDDSVKLSNNGKAVFEGNKTLAGGIYFILLDRGKYFDFLIDKHQDFSIKCDTSDFLNTVRFKDSFQNYKFFSYQKYLNNLYKLISLLKEKQKSVISNFDSLLIIEQQIQIINNKIYLKKEEIVNEHPDSLISVIIKSSIPIVPPPAERDTAGNIIDSLYEFYYYKAHFFDNINFNDERLIRSSIIYNKISDYLNNLTPPYIDSIKLGTDYIISKSQVNEEVYKYVISMLFNEYRTSRIITDENIFVYIAENYYLNNKTPWISDEFKEVLIKNIELRKPNLIGNIAPEIKMENSIGKIINLSEIQNKHVIIYFYNTDCEICKIVTPEMNNFYKIIQDRGVSLIGIYTGENKSEWLNYISEKNLKNWVNVWDPKNQSQYRELYNINGTPVIFLIDEDRKIIAKKITLEQLMNYFNSI
ncbi:MAG: redoxin domain-containing protein [Bacteroidales bacterium]|nr:redoxin domain-containing protein [Bacteroidales bacterium]